MPVRSLTPPPLSPVEALDIRVRGSTFSKQAGAVLYQGDCVKVLKRLAAAGARAACVFADPPYFLSNGGMTCHAGRRVSVNKGNWDVSPGIEETHLFNLAWLSACRDVLDVNGTIWVSGTSHVIYSVGFAMQQLGFKILNNITWYKTNAPPNLSCRYFTHSTETILWAASSTHSRHKFNYAAMKAASNGKQMRDVWEIRAPRSVEKQFGKHPTQKPERLLERILLASTDPGDLVIDPFCGSGTTGVVACRLERPFIGIDIESAYLDLSKQRILAARSAGDGPADQVC